MHADLAISAVAPLKLTLPARQGVLNAFRHQRINRPGGVGGHPPIVMVLNAFRHQRINRPGGVGGHPPIVMVLNAFRHQRINRLNNPLGR